LIGPLIMSKRKSLFGNPKASSLTNFDHIEKRPSPRKSLTIGTPVSFDIQEAPPTSEGEEIFFF
jgi:hypothetical protein